MSETGFVTQAAIIAQNSATGAATLLAGDLAKVIFEEEGPEGLIRVFEQIRTDIFNGSLLLAGAESIVELLETKDAGAASAPARKSWGGGAKKTYEDHGGGVVLKFGKYSGRSIADVYEVDPQAVYAMVDGKSAFLAGKAREYLEFIEG